MSGEKVVLRSSCDVCDVVVSNSVRFTNAYLSSGTTIFEDLFYL